ncbi:dihydroorotase [Ferruginibacter sp. HRS2-29]|uniref:dihydroorotase n=1 Tax=Ferruginibacter sp. HRS2-29 TaxID=2487334 RepID=UPI0020CBDD5C|nr:dihydroorotase [Ferruginibacter sp. HRS2-29]MCP9752151.1 dihydroorotase [Ferruginibacter sp. HRS2-29]
MQKYLFRDILLVNEGKIQASDVLVKGERIEKIAASINEKGNVTEINGEGKYLLPGAIDDQVHFREPGLTHKADIHSESRAAVAGGTTTFMEMPNTIPNALTRELLEQKYAIAKANSLANYSFFMGVSNDNADEALRINEAKNDICGLKIFMGSSTGNMLVDNHSTLNRIFSESELLIATHCEDERIIKRNYELRKNEKNNLEASDHPIIRDEEACFESSLVAVQFAKKYNSRLHILHISAEKELQLFGNMLPLKDKRITSEVCVHHLHFTADDYEKQGYHIKCNPAIKAAYNKEALWEALNDDRLDVIATDHAPHLLSEKTGPYEHAHSGLPLVQHSVSLMLYYHSLGKITLEKIVQKMSHAVADCFQIKDRGYIREGYYADLVMADLQKPATVTRENILYKCGWSPLEGFHFPSSIESTMVSGNLVYEKGALIESHRGQRITFNR